MYGAPMACDVRMLSSEEQRVCLRLCHRHWRIQAARGNVAIRAARKRIQRPAVHICTGQGITNLLLRKPRHLRQLAASRDAKFLGTPPGQLLRARSAGPSRELWQRLGLRMLRPPDGGRVLRREKKAHCAKRFRTDSLRALPPPLTKDHGEAFSGAHHKAPRVREGHRLRVETNAVLAIDI